VLDWHSGQRFSADGDAMHVSDLDVPSMFDVLCAPLHKRTYDKIGNDIGRGIAPFNPYRYEAPYGVHDGPNTPLTLERCGSDDETVLEPWVRRKHRAVLAQLASGFVTWFVVDPVDVPWSYTALRGYLPQCDVRLAWHVALSAAVGHVAGAVMLSEHTGRGWTIQRRDWALRSPARAAAGTGLGWPATCARVDDEHSETFGPRLDRDA
jgi:hypothetical protein